MSTMPRIFKNTGILIAGDVIDKLIYLVLVIYLTRYLGAIGFGKYSFVLAFLVFFRIVTDLGINMILVREVCRDPTKASKLMGNAAVIKLVLSFSAIALAAIIISLLPSPTDTTTYVYILSAILLFDSFSLLFSRIFQVELKMKYFVLANLIYRALSAGLIFLIIFSKGTLLQIIIVLVFSSFIRLMVNYLCSRKFVRPKFKIDFELWRFLARESWPLALAGIFIIIFTRIDQVMLSMMRGDAAVGYYAASVNLVEALGIIPNAFMLSVFPLLSRFFATSRDIHKRTYALSFKYMAILAIPIAVGTTLLANPIIPFIYGNQFLPSVIVLQILIWANVFIFTGTIHYQLLISASKQKYGFLFSGTTAVLNVVLNLGLIPRYGIVGAAIATAISLGTGAIIPLFPTATRAYAIALWRSILKPIIASAVMAVYIYYVRPELALAIVGGIAIFIAAMLLIRGIDREDIRLVRALFRAQGQAYLEAGINDADPKP